MSDCVHASDLNAPRHTDERAFSILIENSEYWLRNNGDLAMLDVTIGRLRALWPSARIGVLTDSPALLAAYFPTARGIGVFDDDPWAERKFSERLAAILGPSVVGPLVIRWLRARTWLPQKARGARRRLRRWRDPFAPEMPVRKRPHTGAMRAAREADLVVALGGGYLTDADAAQTRRVFTLLGHAADHGVPTVLVGQGLGPLADADLVRQARDVLPRAQLIALRERRRGPDLLAQLGVDPDRVRITGDDAIELAHRLPRPMGPSSGIGLCLRVASYSPVSQAAQRHVGEVVRKVAAHLGSDLAPLIVAEYRDQDRRSTLPLVADAPRVRRPLPRFVPPAAVAARVSDCRVVVTGAYHLAVFALAQGIPVVGLTSSQYYDDKFLGLADMFEGGLILIHLDSPRLPTELESAVRRAWDTAPSVAESLRARAAEQIDSSRAAFDRVATLVDQSAGLPG